MKAKHYKQVAIKYANDVVSGQQVAGAEIIAACQRFLDDLEREDLEFRTKEPDAAVTIIEGIFVHRKGEALDGTPLLGKPFKLEPFQIFIVYNLLGFYYTGTNERRFKESLILLARKNGKTSFIAALSFAVAIIQRKSGSTIYVVAAALKQALETFNFLVFTLKYKKMIDDFVVKDNSFEHSIKYEFKTADGRPDGTIEIQVMASNPDAQDSFNCNFAIADEVAAYKKAAQYNRFKEAMKSYTNKLMIGITTAGDNINSFGYDQMQYAVKVAKGIVKDDSFFSFVARADQDEKGNDLKGMAEIIIAKHRNGAVGDVLLRFRGEFARFQNPDDEMIIPMPGETPGVIQSKINRGGGSVPPPPIEDAPMDNPFGAPSGPLPF